MFKRILISLLILVGIVGSIVGEVDASSRLPDPNGMSKSKYKNIFMELNNKGYVFPVKATAYAPQAGGINAQGDPTVTSVGNRTVVGKTLAVDPSIIPYGSIVEIKVDSMPSVNGLYIAEDTGGAIKYNRIDILIEPYSDAKMFGRRDVKLKVLEWGAGPADAREKSKNWDTYLKKYSSIGAGYRYNGRISDGSKGSYGEVDSKYKVDKGMGSEEGLDEDGNKVTPKDYLMYREQVENTSYGVKDGNDLISRGASAWFYHFSEKTLRVLFIIGWAMTALLLLYVSVYTIAYMTVARGSYLQEWFPEKMIKEGKEVYLTGKEGLKKIFIRIIFTLILVVLFASGLYIHLLSLIVGMLVQILI